MVQQFIDREKKLDFLGLKEILAEKIHSIFAREKREIYMTCFSC